MKTSQGHSDQQRIQSTTWPHVAPSMSTMQSIHALLTLIYFTTQEFKDCIKNVEKAERKENAVLFWKRGKGSAAVLCLGRQGAWRLFPCSETVRLLRRSWYWLSGQWWTLGPGAWDHWPGTGWLALSHSVDALVLFPVLFHPCLHQFNRQAAGVSVSSSEQQLQNYHSLTFPTVSEKWTFVKRTFGFHPVVSYSINLR